VVFRQSLISMLSLNSVNLLRPQLIFLLELTSADHKLKSLLWKTFACINPISAKVSTFYVLN